MQYLVNKYEEPYLPLNKNYPDEVMEHWWLGDDKKFKEAVKNYDNYYGTILPEAEITASKPTESKVQDWTSEYNPELDLKLVEQTYGKPIGIKTISYNPQAAFAGEQSAQRSANAVGLPLTGVIAAPFVAPAIGTGIAGAMNSWSAFSAAHPLIAAGVDGALTAHGIYNLFGENGILKTYNHFKNGEVGKGILSGAVDALDVMGGVGLFNRTRLGITTLKNLTNSENIGKNFFTGLKNKLFSKTKQVANNLTSHLLGDDAVTMFKEYSKDYVLPTTETENIRQLRAYIPEVRERYGLVGNNKVSDDDILKSLYKQVSELDGGTAARNIDGEPQLLFRGDTQRYSELKPRVSPEELVTMSGTMDNSLGTLFLGELPGTGVKGQGLERYLVHGREFNGNKRLIGSGTGAHVVSPSGDRISEFDAVASFPHGSRYLVTHTTSRGIPHSYYKLPSTYSSTGVNDINGFVVRTPNMRNASKEISVLNDDFLVQASPDKVSYYGPKRRVLLDKDGFPLLVDESGNVVGNALAGSSERSAMAQHYRYVLDDAKLHNQGLLKSEGGSTNGIPGNYLRDEHTHFNYFALPNFNIRNAKHILPYDFRFPRDWNDPNIYKVALPLIGIGGVGLTLGNNTESYKQGGPIHIKEKNKGKFTESAKRAGKSVQEHARDVVNNPKATKLQKKRALFALNAKKFKH